MNLSKLKVRHFRKVNSVFLVWCNAYDGNRNFIQCFWKFDDSTDLVLLDVDVRVSGAIYEIANEC